jgi:pimeloyl-ACP methyl ester carboxylesterase
LFVTDDLRAVDLWPDAGDPFPGEAQLLARWDGAHPLPGTRADLGAYALQQDWWTTYEGGLGFMSDARGIDDAIARAGDTIGTLRGLELPSGLGVAVLAGTFPFLPVHQDYRSPDPFGEDVADFLGQDASFYSDFYTAALADDFPDLVITAGDADGLASGALMAGEISGRSDGVVFADSALAIDDLLDGGAVLLDSLTVPLSHLDLVLASPLSAAALRAQFLGTPDEAAMLSLADRYEAADTVAWIISVLARGEEIPGDDDDTTPDGDDDSSAADDDSSPAGDDDSAGDDKLQNPDPETPFTGCACSQGRERQFPWWSVAGPVAAGASRRRRKGPRTQTAAPEPTSAPEPSLMVKTTADIEPPMEPTPLTDPPVAQPGVEVQEPPLPVPSDEATQGPGFDPEPPPPGGNPAPLADAVLGPWVDGLRHLRRYLEHGVARRPHGTPWHTSHRIELSMPAADLRVFGAEAGPALLIVAPEINGAQIADYGPGQSLVGAILGHGWARVGLVCWRSAHEGTRGLSIADSIDTIARCAEHLGAPVPVVGICQGGWEAAVLAATRPELVSALVLGAGPIDFHAGNSLMTTLARHTPASWYRALVAAGGGVMPGELLRLGFDSLRPLERFGVRWMELWNGLDDPAFLDRHDRLEAWYGARKDLPGTMYLEAVTELFHGNQLVEGRFELRGRRVDLRDIRCPVALVGGSKDHITPMAQVWALEPFLTGAHARFVLDAGHVGIFIGHGPLHRDWPRILAWVAEHIGPADVPRPTVPVGGSSPSLGAEGISAG